MKARAVWVPGTDAFDLYLWEEQPHGHAMASIEHNDELGAHLIYTWHEQGERVEPTLRIQGRELQGLQEALNSQNVTHELGRTQPDLEWLREALDNSQANYDRAMAMVEMAWQFHYSPPPGSPGVNVSFQTPPPAGGSSSAAPTALKRVPDGND